MTSKDMIQLLRDNYDNIKMLQVLKENDYIHSQDMTKERIENAYTKIDSIYNDQLQKKETLEKAINDMYFFVNSVLSGRDFLLIIERWFNGLNIKDLSIKYGYSEAHINRILGKCYKKLADNYD